MSLSPYEKVKIARKQTRPTSIAYINNIVDDFIELHGDRNFRDDLAIIGGIGYINGLPVTVIAQEKGTSLEDRMNRNFGSPHPEGYRKALRLMKQSQKFRRPILCIVDTQGAYCGVGAEERGQGQAIAQNLMDMMEIDVPIISVFIGEGGSGGALGLAVSDRVYMLEYAVYSILSPEGFASILWKDSSKAQQACDIMKITADDLLKLGIIDGIIKEDDDGVTINSKNVFEDVKNVVYNEFKNLQENSPIKLIDNRYNRFRKMGSEVVCLKNN